MDGFKDGKFSYYVGSLQNPFFDGGGGGGHKKTNIELGGIT